MELHIEEKVKCNLPHLVLRGFKCKVKVQPSSEELLNFIADELLKNEKIHSPESIRDLETVKATKEAYRVLGKDPNRYRPSAEALLRRVASGKGIYRINNVVDVLNIISVKTGFSIGGYDFDNIIGSISMGVGDAAEPYVGIGRGDLNIENLMVFRDELSAFGSPTSDSVRTQVSDKTKTFLMVFIAFSDSELLQNSIVEAIALLKRFAGASDEKLFVTKGGE